MLLGGIQVKAKARELFADFPLAEGAGCSVKVDTHLDNGKAVLLEADELVLHVNLLQGFFC